MSNNQSVADIFQIFEQAQSEEKAHKICGMHPEVAQFLRNEKNAANTEGFERIVSNIKTTNGMTDNLFVWFGANLGRSWYQTPPPNFQAENLVILCFILDPLNIDSKQLTFIKSKINHNLFDVLYKKNFLLPQ